MEILEKKVGHSDLMFQARPRVPEERLELSRGYPHRILSLVADATKARRVCKLPELKPRWLWSL